MKILTTNFLTCAVKSCKTSPNSYPLHFRDAQLERTPIDFNPLFLRNILPRVNWEALQTTAGELGLSAMLPDTNPGELRDEADEIAVQADADTSAEMEVEGGAHGVVSEDVLKKLHEVLLETGVVEGKLVCGNCGFEYPIKEGVGNFLLPAHLV